MLGKMDLGQKFWLEPYNRVFTLKYEKVFIELQR